MIEGNDFHYCLVGRFLIEKPINFLTMNNTLAFIWEPDKGINIMKWDRVVFFFSFSMKWM